VNSYVISGSPQDNQESKTIALRRSPRKLLNKNAAISVMKPISDEHIADNASKLLQRNFFIRIAHSYPKLYLRCLSHIYMTVELISLMTPMIAMGIQWLTALCHTSPLTALIQVFSVLGYCLSVGDFQCDAVQDSCIVIHNNNTIPRI
jgi:hypothetical protein